MTSFVLVLCIALLCTGCVYARLHAVVYASKLDFPVSLMLASASANNVSIVMLGAGDKASWGQGLIKKFQRLNEYILTSVADDDVLLGMDATDTLFLGGESELLSKYDLHVKSGGAPIVFNAQNGEGVGNSHLGVARLREFGQLAQTKRGITQNPFWLLNAGAFIGRGAELKQLLQNWSSIRDYEHDQAWLQAVAASNPQLVSVDYSAALFIVLFDMRNEAGLAQWPGSGNLADFVKFEFGRVVFVPSGERPVLLHFAGPGHWGANGTCLLFDVMKHRYAQELVQIGYALIDDSNIACGMKGLNQEFARYRRRYKIVSIWAASASVVAALLILILLGAITKVRRFTTCCSYKWKTHGGDAIKSEDDTV